MSSGIHGIQEARLFLRWRTEGRSELSGFPLSIEQLEQN